MTNIRRNNKERRLSLLQQQLVAAAKGPKIRVSLSDIRKKGLIATLRAQANRSR